MACMCEGVCVCLCVSGVRIALKSACIKVKSAVSFRLSTADAADVLSEANKNNILSMEREIEKDATRMRTWLRNNEPGLSKMRLPMPKPKPMPQVPRTMAEDAGRQ